MDYAVKLRVIVKQQEQYESLAESAFRRGSLPLRMVKKCPMTSSQVHWKQLVSFQALKGWNLYN